MGHRCRSRSFRSISLAAAARSRPGTLCVGSNRAFHRGQDSPSQTRWRPNPPALSSHIVRADRRGKDDGACRPVVGPVLMALLVAIWREWLLTTESAITPEAELESAVPFDDAAPTEGVVATAVIAPQKTTAWSPKAQEVPGPYRGPERSGDPMNRSSIWQIASQNPRTAVVFQASRIFTMSRRAAIT